LVLNGGIEKYDFYCKIGSLPEGVQSTHNNIMAKVKLHGENEITKYNVKSHHFGPKICRDDAPSSVNKSVKGSKPDIIEFYCYKLLELIKVGPEVHFIFPKNRRKLQKRISKKPVRTDAYIATKWDDEFVRISQTKDLDVDVCVQLTLLRTLLLISDLNEDNCGYRKDTKDAIIVDFSPKFEVFNIKNAKGVLLDTRPHEGWEDKYNAAMKQCDENKRLKIAKQYLDKWNLELYITDTQTQMKKDYDRLTKEVAFKNNPINDITNFINDVKRRLEELTKLLPISQ